MKYWTMRTKLYILIIIAVLPFLILQFDELASRYDQAINTELQASQEFAEAIRATMMNYFQNLWDLEYAIGQAWIVGDKPLSVDQMEKYLKEMMAKHPTIQGIAWIDPHGTIIATTEPAVRGNSVVDRPYFQDAVSGGEIFVSNLVHVNVVDRLVLPVTRVIYQDGKPLGIVVIGLDLQQLNLVLPVELKGRTASYGFVDGNGYLVYYYGNDNVVRNQLKLSPISPAWKALAGEVVITEEYFSELTQEKRMGAILPVPQIGWAVFATVSVEEVLANATRTNRRDMFVLCLALIISFIGVLILSNHFLRPLLSLQRAARAISLGKLDSRAVIGGSDELAETGKIFDHMAEQVEKLEVSRTRFLQTAAHELRNPMAGIKGLLTLMYRRIGQGHTVQEVLPLLKIMEREIDRLSMLLTQILEAFRTQRENGYLTLDLKKIDIGELVEKALDPFINAETRCTFQFRPEISNPVWVSGDMMRLEEVLRNLFGNALKYSPNGGNVIVTISQHLNYVLIGVEDEGVGIAESQLQDIFKCFHRAVDKKDQDPGGLGLGLYISREIIHKHGGRIWAESKVGSGSKFFIELPLYTEQEETILQNNPT